MKTFISYSRPNREQVEALAKDLSDNGLTPWFDRELTGGHEWWAKICSKILTCDLFVFALSPASLKSYPCQLEYEYAHRLNKRILPVLLVEVNRNQLLPALSAVQYVDYRERTLDAYKVLQRAILQLPDASPPPNLLPPCPETPLPRLVRLRERVKAPPSDLNGQRLLILDIEDAIDDGEDRAECLSLLQALLNYDQLMKGASRRIEALLGKTSKNMFVPAKQAFPLLQPRILKHKYGVTSVAFSPNMQYIVTNGGDGGEYRTAQLWDAQTGKFVRTFQGHSNHVQQVAFSPNGLRILTGSTDNKPRLWDVQTGQTLKILEGHKDSEFKDLEGVHSVGFSPDGHTALTGGADNTVRLWDIHSGQNIKTEEQDTREGVNVGFWSVVFSPDGDTALLGGSGNIVYLWDIRTWQEIRAFKGQNRYGGHSTAFSPDGSIVLTTDDSLARLWDIHTGKLINVLAGHVETIWSVAFSPDGLRIVTSSSDKTARLWDVQTGKPIKILEGHKSYVYSVAFSPDGRYILTGSYDKTARIWSVEELLR